MNKPNMSKIFKEVQFALSKHSPEILTGIGIAGMITTTVLAVKVTPKAYSLILDEQFVRDEDGVEYSKLDMIKTCWRCYIPAAITCSASIACLVGASSVNAKRNAMLATAYKLSESALTEYKEKVVETLGEKKEHSIKDKISEDRVKDNPASKNEVIITEKGNTLFYDYLSGRYFKSDIDKIKKAENKLNRDMLSDMYVSLNDFYDEIGIEHIGTGEELGWNIDDGMISVYFSSQITDDDQPCIVLNHDNMPKYNFTKLV